MKLYYRILIIKIYSKPFKIQILKRLLLTPNLKFLSSLVENHFLMKKKFEKNWLLPFNYFFCEWTFI